MTTKNTLSSHFEAQKVVFLGRDPKMNRPGSDTSHYHIIFGITDRVVGNYSDLRYGREARHRLRELKVEYCNQGKHLASV